MAQTLSIKKNIVPVIVLAAVCLAIFSNTFGDEFFWDDYLLIKIDDSIKDIKNLSLFFSPDYWNESYFFEGQYRPIRRISLALDYWLWELNPTGYHLTNILLHAINTLLVFGLVSLIPGPKTGSTARGAGTGWKDLMGIPFVTALLFAIHPIHTESINFIKNRSDLLAFLFFLLSFQLFVRHLRVNNRATALTLLIAAWLSFVPAVLSKEMALTLPVVLAFYAICFLPAPERKKVFVRIGPYGLLVFLYFWFRLSCIGWHEDAGFGPSGLGRQALAVVKTLGLYFKMLVIPFPLNPEHVFIVPASVFEVPVVLSLSALAGFCITCFRAYRGERLVFFALGWILLTLLPVANIFYLPTRPIAEQRLYIPSLGFCLLIGYGFKRLPRLTSQPLHKKRLVMLSGFLLSFIIIGYTVLTVQRNDEWRDAVTFFSKAVALNPDSRDMNYNLAIAYLNAQRKEEAARQFQAVLRLDPQSFDVHFNLGVILKELGRYTEAIAHYQEALRRRPDACGAHYNLGLALDASGRFEEAVNHYLAATRIKPDFFEAYYNLGLVFYKAGRYQEAIDYYLSALQIKPDNVETLNNLGAVFYGLGRLQDAGQYYQEVLKHAPDNLNANVNIGNIFLDQGRFDEAVSHYLIGLRATIENDTAIRQALYRAIIQTGRFARSIQHLLGPVQLQPGDAEGLNTFGMTLIETGHVEEGIDYYRSVLKIMPDNADAYCNLGVAAMIQGRYDQANVFFRRSLAIDPDHPRATAAYQESLGRMGPAPVSGLTNVGGK